MNRAELIRLCNNGNGALVPVKGTLIASKAFWTISCSHLRGNILGMTHFCSSVTPRQYMMQGPKRLEWTCLVWKNFTGLYIFLMDHLWDEFEQRLGARPSHPTWTSDFSNAPLENGLKFLKKHTHKLKLWKPPKRTLHMLKKEKWLGYCFVFLWLHSLVVCTCF